MKFKALSTLAGLFASAVLSLAAPAHAADESLSAVLAKKSIALGVASDFPPYGYMGPDFKLTGVDVATAQLIADKLGVKAELVPVSTPNRIPYLQTKKIDLIVSALGKNPEREKVIDFTVAYAPFFQAVFGPKALSIKSFDDLAGKSIAVTRGTIQDELMTIVRQTQQTVFMITHDVDEAILLADRILLMSNGNESEAGYVPGGIAEVVVNPLPRERVRASLHHLDGYYELRNHIVDFLVSRAIAH